MSIFYKRKTNWRLLSLKGAGFISAAAAFLLFISSAYAVIYAPGATLNPSCNPGDSNCDVAAPVYTTSTISDGALLYSTSSIWQTLSIGSLGQVLAVNSLGLPAWLTPMATTTVNGVSGPALNLLNGGYIGISTSTNSITLTNIGVQTLTAGNDLTITSATGTPILAVTSTPSFTSVSSTNVFSTTATTTNLFATGLITGAGGLTISGGATTLNGGAISLASSTFANGGVGAIIVDSNGAISLGTSSATGVNIGRAGITTTIFGTSSLGAITAGTWNGSVIGAAYGGTGTSTAPSNGQLLIGNGANYGLSTLTQGSNALITNAAGSITVAVTSTPTFSGLLTGSNGLTISAGTISLPAGSLSNIMLANSTTTLTAGNMLYYSAGASSLGLGSTNTLAVTSTPSFTSLTLTNPLTVANGGTGTSTALTNGSILFATSGVVSQNNSQLFWDNTNNRLGIGTTTPATLFEAYGTSTFMNGNVGIGTTTPGSKLEIDSGGGISVILQRTSVYTGNQWIDWRNASGTEIGYVGFSSSADERFSIANAQNSFINILTNGGERMRIDSAGNVGIGTTSPAQTFHVYQTAAGSVARFTNSAGYCEINPTNTALVCTSDINLKKNIVTLNSELANVLSLNPVNFNWKNENDSETKHLGFIAQEVEKIFPQIVSTESNGTKAVAYDNFIPILTKAIQEQQAQIIALKNQLTLAQNVGLGGVSLNGLNQLTISGALSVAGHVSLGQDSAGEATVYAGTLSAHIAFLQGYTEKPIITISPENRFTGNYWITNITSNGFDIAIDHPQPGNATFAWHAFAQKGNPFTVGAALPQLAAASGSSNNISNATTSSATSSATSTTISTASSSTSSSSNATMKK